LKLAPRPLLVVADAVLVQQVIINLIMNALGGDDGIRGAPVPLTLGTAAGVDGSCTVTVGDTGPGITPALAGQIFHTYVTSKPQGMGLGLAISRSIIEQHAGRIWYEPAAEGGAIFQVHVARRAVGQKRSTSMTQPHTTV